MSASVLVSVVIPVFNGHGYILNALDSVVCQTIRDLEIIVVDDGSTDGTPSVVRGYPDQRITLLEQRNAGPSTARNRGITHSTGRYVAFLDADDLWVPHKLEDQLVALSTADGARWGYSPAVTTSFRTGEELAIHPAIHHGDILCALMQKNCISGSASSVIAERELLRTVGGFDETLGYAEDWELWARLASSSAAACTERPGVIIRSREKSYGADAERMRAESLRFLERAFCTYARRCSHVRSTAMAWVHFLAGIGLRSDHQPIRAMHAFALAAWHRPLWELPYRAMLATLAARRIREAFSFLTRPEHDTK